MSKYLINIIYILLLIGLIYKIPIESNWNQWTLITRAFLIILLCLGSIIFLKKLFYDVDIREKIKTPTLLLSILFILFMALELVFMFIPRSHSVGYTYGSRIWFNRYWNVNSYGFRDIEPQNKKSTILFVGDSFTAGHGIISIDNRFSNIVCNQLNSYNCINLGVNGIDTETEFVTMKQFLTSSKITPKTIVLQYFGNDIDKLALKNGLKFEGFKPYENLNFIGKKIVLGSFLLNYIYWTFPHADVTPYGNFLSQAYSNPLIFNNHLVSLDKFVNFSKQNNIRLIVVVFPFMLNPEISQKLYSNNIISHLKRKGIETVDVSKHIGHLNPKDLVINSNDGHCSEEVHTIVANELTNIIQE